MSGSAARVGRFDGPLWVMLTLFGVVCLIVSALSVPTAIAEPEGIFGEAFRDIALLTIAIAFPVGALALIAAYEIRGRLRG